MKCRKLLNIVVVLCLLNAANLAAGETLSLSLEQVIELALEKNRDLHIASLEIERAKSRSRWSGRLDNPGLEISGANDFIGLDEGEAVLELAFVQKFPLTSRLKDEKKVRAVQVLLAQTELAENRRVLAYEVHNLAVKLLAGKITRAGQERLINLNKEISDSLHKRAQMGEASKLDVTQMRLNGRSLDRGASALDAQMAKLQMQLKEKLNLNPDQVIDLKGVLKLPGSAPVGKVNFDAVLQNRPDYLAALVEADVARAELVLQKAKRWEDVGVSLLAVSDKSEDEPVGLDRNTFLGIGFSIPLPLRKRNQEAVEVAGINIDASVRKGDAKKFVIENELATVLQVRAAAWKLASEAVGKDARLANENFEAFKTAYQNGQVGIIQVQRAQEQLIKLETTALELQRKYHLADAAVRFVRGSYQGLRIPFPSPSK